MKIPRFCHLACRLRELGLNQTDLAYAMGLSHTAISNRMIGKTPWNVIEMYRVLEVCRAQPEELHLYFPAPQKKRGAA